MTILESQFDEYTIRGKTYRYKTFDKIETPDQAYFLGYMSADGAFIKNKQGNSSYPVMSVCSTDIYLIKHFAKEYCPDSHFAIRDPRSSNKVNATKKVGELRFLAKMSPMFKRFGLLDYKPNRIMVGVPKKFHSAYVLGIMDADGCFIVRHRRDCRTPRLNVHIVSSAVKVLENVQRILETDLNIASSIYQRKNQKCLELRINNTDRAIDFGNWIYSNIPSTYNHKKYKIFRSYISKYTDTSSKKNSCTNSGELLEA